MRNIRRVFAVVALSTLALVGCASHTGEPSNPPTDYSAVFNEGFMDSKRDDCEMGFQPACTWLANNY